jgi:cytochrome P450 family 130
MVVADYLGVPEQDRSHFYGWAQKVASANLGDGSEDRQPILAAFTTMTGYFIELMKLRRSVPGDDTISQILAAGIGGGDEAIGMLSLLAFTFAIVAGGIDTTIGMLGGAVQLLHQRTDQRRLLARNPGSIPASIDEFLRLTSPVQMKTRVVTRDVMVGDTQIPAGRKVLLLYGSGNRDERQYGPDAGRLDVRRRPANILAFGHGATGCPGSALARMQAQVVLTELLTRCPDFEVDEANIVWANTSHVRRPLSLPFRIGS